MISVEFLATYGGDGAQHLPAVELSGGQNTLESLRKLFYEQTGLDAFVLHSSGLELTLSSQNYLVRLELAAPPTKPATAPYSPLPHARPWQQPGWFRETLSWLETMLGETVTGLEQVSSNDLAAVLRVKTASRTVYLKASETELEAALSAHLAARHSDLTPAVIAWDASRNLLLTQDCGARLSETADLKRWREAVRKLAYFQRAADSDALKALGCPSHSFADLAERATLFLQDDAILQTWGLKAEQIKALNEHLPYIVRAHERVERLELPLLPAHGDAHPMNILGGCGAALFDWSEACIAHPLLDVGWFLAWLTHPGRASLPLRQQYPNAAHALWNDYLQSSSWVGAEIYLSDAVSLALIHRALVYHDRFFEWQGTVPGWRPQHVPYMLRSLLKLSL